MGTEIFFFTAMFRQALKHTKPLHNVYWGSPSRDKEPSTQDNWYYECKELCLHASYNLSWHDAKQRDTLSKVTIWQEWSIKLWGPEWDSNLSQQDGQMDPVPSNTCNSRFSSPTLCWMPGYPLELETKHSSTQFSINIMALFILCLLKVKLSLCLTDYYAIKTYPTNN